MYGSDLARGSGKGDCFWRKARDETTNGSGGTPSRQTVTLSAGVARRVRTLDRAKRASTGRVIAELVESGLEAQEAERHRFLQLADRLSSCKDPAEQQRIREELARLTFGD
jgi:hypothetical protein